MFDEFEFDERKSRSNLEKHGIDFTEAIELWTDPRGLIVPALTKDGESRWALIAERRGKCYVAIFTERSGKIRIISVRRCRKREKEHYEGDYDERVR
ncbi:BrnT family toxin [Nitratifractor sp.]